ncbi:MAG: hypothetical protein OZ932_07205, partial [Flavobacteriia bacterium]|nr:hypothetical protein [Flavobacteriia bacterium]
PDGRLLLAGNYWLRDSVRGFVGWQYGLVWLNSDGSLDTTRIHRSIGGAFGAMEHIREMPDGKFMCSGGSGQFEGVPVEGMFRVHADGSLDTTFQVPHIDDWTESYGFLPLPGGKVLAYGRWHFAGMSDWVSLVRFLPNGQLDPTFNNNLDFEVTYPGTWPPIIMDVEPIGDGMLAITGTFDRINGEVHGGIAMIDTAGNLLPGYFGGNGCGGLQEGTAMPTWYQGILGIKPAQDGGYFIYGAYRGYDDGTTNDASQRLLSKLYGLNVGIEEQATGQPAPLQIAPNPASGAVQLAVGMAPPVQAMLTIHDASGRMVLQEPWPAGGFTHTLQAGTLAPGAYVARLGAGAGTALYTGRLVVVP